MVETGRERGRDAPSTDTGGPDGRRARCNCARSWLLGRASAALRAAGRRRRLHRLLQQGDDGYQAMRWSNSKSGSGWPRRSHSGIGSGVSSQADGPRAGAIGGGRDGSPMWVRIRATGASSAPELGSQQGAVCRLWRPCYPPRPANPANGRKRPYAEVTGSARMLAVSQNRRGLAGDCRLLACLPLQSSVTDLRL